QLAAGLYVGVGSKADSTGSEIQILKRHIAVAGAVNDRTHFSRSMRLRVSAVIVMIALFAQTAMAADPDTVYRHGIEALYNLDFAIADTDFKNLTTEHPEDPLYWNSMASVIWLKILYDQQKLNIE